MKVLVAQSCPTLATLWTIARQAPLSMGFPSQEYWNGLPFPSPGDLPQPGIEPGSREESDTTERFPFHFHALEKEMATHSTVLIWRISGMGKPGGLPSIGSHRVGHD